MGRTKSNSRSRSSSPLKLGGVRTPLGVKDANVIRSSPSLKRTSKLQFSSAFVSPSKRSIPLGTYSSPTKRQKTPVKQETQHALPLDEEFTIYEDPEDYSARFSNTVTISAVPEENKENARSASVPVEGKPGNEDENAVTDRVPQTLRGAARRPLHDLPITDFPGFIQEHPTTEGGVLASKEQLLYSWMVNTENPSAKVISIPSYVTPPKRRTIHYKFVKSLNQVAGKGSHNSLRRSSISGTDTIKLETARRRLSFSMFDDVQHSKTVKQKNVRRL